MALTNKLKAIGDAIRNKTGKTDKLTLDEMVTEIEGISGGGEIKPNPAELYQRLNYLESTTLCRIDTDIYADNSIGMELLSKYSVLADRVPMGSRLDGDATRFYVPYPLSANSFYYGFNSGTTKSTGAKADTVYRSSINFLNNRVATIKEDSTNTIEFVDLLKTSLTAQTAPIGIFCYLRNNDGVISYPSTRDMIFYKARISKKDQVIREYVPCYRKSDGVIGLYEKFTGQFLENKGTGTFTAGSEIEWES